MNESRTYQAILQDGVLKGEQQWRVEEARKLLLQLGSDLLGQPDTRMQRKLAKIAELDRLEALVKRLPTVDNWQDLLANAPAHSSAETETSYILNSLKDSSTYQTIVQEGYQEGYQEGVVLGAIEEARKILLLLGIPKLGRLSATTLTALTTIEDLDRLEVFLERLDKVESWHALLGETSVDRS